MVNPHANQISAPSTNRGTGALEVIALEFRSEVQGSSHSCLYDWIISLDKKNLSHLTQLYLTILFLEPEWALSQL